MVQTRVIAIFHSSLTGASMPTSTTAKVNNFFGLTAQQAEKENARAVVIPVSCENKHKETREGAKAILEASRNLELFDDELWVEPYKIGIHSAPALKVECPGAESEAPYAEVIEAVKPLLDMDRFGILVGSDRAISLGGVLSCLDKYPDLSVLRLGGQADLRSEVEGNPYDAAASSYQIYTSLKKPLMAEVGVRNISWEEVAWLEKEQPKLDIFWARNQHKLDWMDVLNSLGENVYLSIDMSVFDPSIMPAVQQPEPGGLSWYPLLQLLKLLFVRKHVVAADLTGLAPLKGLNAPNHIAAHLLYKLIGYRFALELGVSKKYL